jgi:N-acetylglucosaminyldiphosphoundecaprenol N-acetyl-beta-D-mannosaminyltransferase
VKVVQTIQVLGVPLARVTIAEAVRFGLAGGLVLAPSGPGLSELDRDPYYRDALLGSDLNLTDSGLLILAHALCRGERLPRTSGLGYLDELLRRDELKRPRATFWVMPSERSMRRNLDWVRSRGFEIGEDDCYVAPLYPRCGPVADEMLRSLLVERAPKHIFICVGGGAQEKLGLYLKQNLPYRPGIHCIGAAIAFLSGDQASIPRWADRMLLGWLVRCISDPKTFIPRYLRAFRLVYLLARYRASAPPIARAGR